MAEDYYNILGLERGAKSEEIKRAYKELAKKYHPDLNKEKGAEDKFKEVQHAYSILGDSQKRHSYDQFGEQGERFSGSSGFAGFEDGADFSDIFSQFGFGGGFSDIFGEQFGGGRRGPLRGEDIAVRLNLSFEEAAFGAKKEIGLDVVEECAECEGSGAKSSSGKKKCDQCGGSGVQRQTRRTFLGTIQTQSTCSKCRGLGEIIIDHCKTCQGSGRVRKRKKITITIPEGIDTGQNLRMRAQGNAGERGATKGDLIAIIYVEPHEIFRRDGEDIYMEAPLSFSEAALGTNIDIPTLKGKARLKIPAGTQSGTIFKMADRGIKIVNKSQHGDQYVKVIVKTPEKPSKHEMELLEKLSKEEEVSKGRKGFFGRFKGIFE